jgi:hypothetical protein
VNSPAASSSLQRVAKPGHVLLAGAHMQRVQWLVEARAVQSITPHPMACLITELQLAALKAFGQRFIPLGRQNFC